MVERDDGVKVDRLVANKIYVTGKDLKPDRNFPEFSIDEVVSILHVPFRFRFGIRLKNREKLITIKTYKHELWMDYVPKDCFKNRNPNTFGNFRFIRIIPDTPLTRSYYLKSHLQPKTGFQNHELNMNHIGKN